MFMCNLLRLYFVCYKLHFVLTKCPTCILNHYINVKYCREKKLQAVYLWSPYVIGQTIIFLPFDFYLLLLLLLFSSPNLSDRRLDVYHTSTNGVALVRI